MPSLGDVLGALLFLGLGIFMVFFPKAAEEVHRRNPFIRTGGALRAPFGWAGIILGAVWSTILIARALYAPA